MIVLMPAILNQYPAVRVSLSGFFKLCEFFLSSLRKRDRDVVGLVSCCGQASRLAGEVGDGARSGALAKAGASGAVVHFRCLAHQQSPLLDTTPTLPHFEPAPCS